MNKKIIKLREKLEENKNKINELQGKNRELTAQLRELENTDIIGLVRERGWTLEQFMALMDSTPVQDEEEEV